MVAAKDAHINLKDAHIAVKNAHIAALQTQLSGMLKTKSKVYNVHKLRVHHTYNSIV